MRTAVLALALLGGSATGLIGCVVAGSAFADVARVEHAQALRPGLVTPQVVAEAKNKRNAAIALLLSGVLGIAGAVLARRTKLASVPLLIGGIAPMPFALWALCPASPLLIAGVLALISKPPESPREPLSR